MKVLVLAAGYGTRLYPIIKDTPKPLLEVAGKSLINHLLDRLKDCNNISEILVVTNEKFYSHFLKWAELNGNEVAPIKVVNDGTTSPDDRLGSVGDIDFVLKNYPVDEDLFVVGGDNLFDFSLKDFISFAEQKRPNVSIGLYDIHDIESAKKFGVVEIDGEGNVISFEEKPDAPKSSLIAMCSYYFPKETLSCVADYLAATHKADKAGDYIHWLAVEKGVCGFRFEGKWYDIGSIESYRDAQEKFKNQS